MSDETTRQDVVSILMVDDNPANLQVLTSMLKQSGWRPRPVTSGQLGLQAARKEPPDLVLLDVRMPEIEGIEIATRYWTPVESVEVGGDFYDVFPLSSNRWGITIGDISGKGITAAALTGLARQTIRASARHRHTPSQVLTWLHEALVDQGSRYGGQNCTALYGILERRRGGFVFRFALGGHPQPVLLGADGSAEFVGRYGTLLGAIPELHHHEVASGGQGEIGRGHGSDH